MPRRIMVAIDKSQCAFHALKLALREASLDGAHVEIVHVIDYGFLKFEHSARDLVQDQRTCAAQASELLDRAARVADEAGVHHSELLINETSTLGDITGRLLDHINTTLPNLVVVGTHGLSGLTRVVLGSVAESLVRHAPVPVLLVRTDMTIK